MDQNSDYSPPNLYGSCDDEASLLMKTNDELIQTRAAIVDLLAEMEDILLRQNPRIDAEWQVVVGVWENKLLEAQISMRRAKRKYALVQASVNTGSAIDLAAIETQLEREFEEWRMQLEEAVEQYHTALELQMSVVRVSLPDAIEQKSLFRKLAKRLHPDLHPELSESHRHIFALAELAYRQGDTKILRSLEISTRNLEPRIQLPTTVIEAEAELALLQSQADEIRRRISQIKTDKPYSLRALLNDETWVKEHISELESEIEACAESERRYLFRCREAGGEHE